MRFRGLAVAVVLVALAVSAPAVAASTDATTGSGDGAAVNGLGTAPGGETGDTAAVAAAGGGPDATRGGVTASPGDARAVDVQFTYRRLPEQAGTVVVTLSLSNTERLETFSVGLHEGQYVVDADGFSRSDGYYEWDGGQGATLTYRWNLSASSFGVSGENWALVRHLQPTIGWTGPDISTSVSMAGEGYRSESVLLLGNHTVHRTEAGGRTLAVVVPAGVTTRHGAETYLGALANASESLDAGADDERVVGFATPVIPTTSLLASGVTVGDRTFIADENASVNTWIHEYVHTTQELRLDDGMRWFTEGGATYFAAQVAVEHGYGDWESFRYGMLLQTHDDGSVLATPDSWESGSDYDKGGATLALVDRRIREATDGERTLEDVYRRLNTRDEEVTVGDFVAVVRDVGGEEAAAAAERYVTTEAIPPYEWSLNTYEDAYGIEPALLLTEVGRLRANGTAWSRTLSTTDDEVQVGVGETLRTTMRVSNNGGTAGRFRYVPEMSPTGQPPQSRIGDPWSQWLAPGKAVERTYGHRFTEPGNYTIWWGNVGEVEVQVVPDRGTATVTDVDVERQPTRSVSAQVDVRVRNDGERPTFVTVPIAVDGQQVETRAFVLDPGEVKTVYVNQEFSTAGDHTIAVGGAEATVTLSTPTPTPSPTPGEATAESTNTGESTSATDTTTGSPGFGLVAATVALALAVVAGRRRR